MLQWIKSQQNYFKNTVAMIRVLLAMVFLFFFCITPALAQTTSNGNVGTAGADLQSGLTVIEKPLGLPSDDVRVVVARVIRVALGLVGIVMVVLILYGGWLWMSAGGNENQIEKAKQVLINAAIGLAIILSAYGIVLFVMRLFGVGDGSGLNGSGGTGSSVVVQNFQGSGALGGIIKDHYPSRDQVDVPRNSKIIISFRKPIKLDSFILNTNKSSDKNGKEIFGDCINIGQQMNWETDCDAVVLDDDHISIRRVDNNQVIRGASIIAQIQDGKTYTIVIRPYDYLGATDQKIDYKVHLGKDILLDDETNNNPSAFNTKAIGNNYYEWKFGCSTVLDTQPPVIQSVFPKNKSIEPKNSVLQVDFNKAMDPTSIQGSFKNGDGSTYVLDGDVIFLKNANSSLPLGNFLLTNGYRTLEFTSLQQCGKNSCGSSIYCLPVCNKNGASCTSDLYEILIRSAKTFNSTSFEAIPLSGAMDVVGNALDGNANGKVDSASSVGAVFPDQKKPDNYFWSFTLNDSVDNTAPILEQIKPGLDAMYIGPQDDLSLLFNKRMRVDPMYSISIEQNPIRDIPLCRVPRVSFDEARNSTLTSLSHCPFLQGTRNYYLPVVTSQVEDVHFNCFYPGKGPGGKDEINKHLKTSSMCDVSGKNCCEVSALTPNNSFCCNGLVSTEQNSSDTCIELLRSTSL